MLKSKGGLKLQLAKKHTHQNIDCSENPTVSPQELLMLLSKTLQKIRSQDMYPQDILLEKHNLQGNISIELIDKLHKDICTKIKFKNTESFYISYYNNSVSESMGYFSQVESKCVTVVIRKLADELIKFVMTKRNPETEEIITKNLSEKEVSDLQYLGGYVLITKTKMLKFQKL